MKILLSCLLLLPSLMHAADLRAIAKTPAIISVLNMKPVPLATSTLKEGWANIPALLTNHGATIFMPPPGNNGAVNGVANIEIQADGYLIIACNWDYQGNSSGDWEKDRWTESKFKSKGWDRLNKGELGGELISNNSKRVQTLFFKKVKKGETMRLRCNKYDPPFPILLVSKP